MAAVDPRQTGIQLAPSLLGASAVTGMTVPVTLVETALATVTIPAGAMGLNGGLMIVSAWTFTNSANVKTLRVRLGGIGGTAFLSTGPTTNVTFMDIRHIRNRGSMSSQIGSLSGSAPIGLTSNTFITGAIDMSVAQDLVFTGQLALNSETLTLERYEVWLLP